MDEELLGWNTCRNRRGIVHNYGNLPSDDGDNDDPRVTNQVNTVTLDDDAPANHEESAATSSQETRRTTSSPDHTERKRGLSSDD